MKNHRDAAIRTIIRAKDCNSAVLYAAKYLARHCKRCTCGFCGNRIHAAKLSLGHKD